MTTSTPRPLHPRDAARTPSREMSPREYAADAWVHALGLVAAGIGAAVLLVMCALRRDVATLVAVAIYAVGLVAMLGCSAAYNMARDPWRKAWLRRFDHAGIFLMIAGTYTPFTTLELTGGWAIAMTGLVWGVALAGIVLKLGWPGRLDGLSTGLYLALGWIVVVALRPLAAAVPAPALVLLGLGGLIYTAGIVFHLWEKLPFQKALWHGFVLAAASVHYAAIFRMTALA